MAKIDYLDILYSRKRADQEFDFDSLYHPCNIYNFLSNQDVQMLNEIATSVKYAANIDLKYYLIDQIMTARGFKKFAAGTNRVVYNFLEDQTFVLKIAVDKVGMKDNPAEYFNQMLLKPFVSKVFNITPCGTVGMFERLYPITTKEEFASIADDVFKLIVYKLIGNYIIDDFGSKYFMNYGIRQGFGPCLLDFPYVYELDGNKLICNNTNMETGVVCGGVIDYDAGFNDLICTNCGKHYIARELEKAKEDKLIILKGDDIMKAYLTMADGTIYGGENVQVSSDVIKKPPMTVKQEAPKQQEFKAYINALHCCCDECHGHNHDHEKEIDVEQSREIIQHQLQDFVAHANTISKEALTSFITHEVTEAAKSRFIPTIENVSDDEQESEETDIFNGPIDNEEEQSSDNINDNEKIQSDPIEEDILPEEKDESSKADNESTATSSRSYSRNARGQFIKKEVQDISELAEEDDQYELGKKKGQQKFNSGYEKKKREIEKQSRKKANLDNY